MSQFLSGFGFKNGDIRISDYTDYHSFMERAWNLKEHPDNEWVKWEYISFVLTDINTYSLIIEETNIPSWVTDKIKEKWERKIKAKLKSMILLDGEYDVLLGGKYVLGGNVKVNTIISSNIISIRDSVIVKSIGGLATVESIRGSVTVESIKNSATVKHIGDSANVKSIEGFANVEVLGGSVTVESIRDSATVECIDNSAKIINDNR